MGTVSVSLACIHMLKAHYVRSVASEAPFPMLIILNTAIHLISE